jgi:hypothetical protein
MADGPLEKLVVTHLVNKLWRPKFHYPVHKSVQLNFVCNHLNAFHTLTAFALHLQMKLCTYLFPTCLLNAQSSNQFNNIWWGYRLWECFVCNCFNLLAAFCLFGPMLFYKILGLCSWINMSDHSSHSHKRRRNIVF